MWSKTSVVRLAVWALLCAPAVSVGGEKWDGAAAKPLEQVSFPKKSKLAQLVPQIGHTRPITSISASTDHAILATASGFDDGVVKVWNGKTGALLHDLQAEDYVAVSPDGKLIATGEQSGPVVIWDSATGARVKELEASGPVRFTPDGKTLLCVAAGESAEPGALRRFEVAGWGKQAELVGHTSSVLALETSADGQLVASASWDGTVKLWRLADGELVRTIQVPDLSPEAIALSPDGAQVAIAWQGKREVQIWDLASSKVLRTLAGHKAAPTHLAYSPDGKRLVSSAPAEGIVVWSVADGKQASKIAGSGALVFEADGAHLLRGDLALHRHDATSGEETTRFGAQPTHIYRVAWAADGETLITTDMEQRVELWSVKTSKLTRALKLPTTREQGGQRVVSAEIILSPRGDLAALRDFSAPDVRIWDLGADKLVRTISTGGAMLHGLSWSPDEQEMILIKGGDEQTELSWIKVATGEELNRSRSDGSVRGAGFVDGGKNAALVTTGSQRNARLALRLWERETNMVRSAKIPDIAPFSGDINFAGVGMLVAISDADHTIKLWDRATQAVVRTLPKHGGHINLARFSPDGALLLTSGWDETVRLWDTRTGQLIWSQRALLKAQDAAFSPDGKRLAIAHQGWVQLIDLPTGRWRMMWRFEDGALMVDSAGRHGCEGAACGRLVGRDKDGAQLASDDAAVKGASGITAW